MQMRTRACVCLLITAAAAVSIRAAAPSGQTLRYRTLDDRFTVHRYASLDEWRNRAAWLREHILASAGLLPMPERTPLNAVIFGELKHPDYTV